MSDPGIVHQRVQPSARERRERGDLPLPGLSVPNVQNMLTAGRRPDLGGRPLQSRAVNIRQARKPALAGETFCGGKADAAGGARDEDRLSVVGGHV